MVEIPTRNTTLQQIDIIVEESERREYLSMSGIGHKCIRKLWMDFRWVTKKVLDAKTLRIFERGNIEEHRIIKDLHKVGVEVYRLEGEERIPLTGKIGEKQEEIIGFAGHSKGHTDGRCINLIEAPKTEHLLEMKSCNDKYFKQFVKEGLKQTWPAYYDQMTIYMGYQKLKRGFFVATNKNDEERHAERVYFDKDRFEYLKEKESNVIMSEFIPAIQHPFKPTWYECRWCDHKYTCHYEYYERHGEAKYPDRNCRTCKFADLGDEGKWFCSAQNDKQLSGEAQEKGCDMYKLGIYETN